MQKLGLLISLFCLLAALSSKAQTREAREATVEGALVRVVGVGGETTGWAIRFESEVVIEGRRLRSIEVSYNAGKLAMFEDKHVRANGKIISRRGVERGEWLVLEINSIEEIKPK